MHCTKCGYRIETDGMFCPHCGSRLATGEQVPVIPPSQMNPPKAWPDPSTNNQPSTTPPKSDDPKTGRITMIVVAAFALLFCIAFLLNALPFEESEDSSSSKSSDSSAAATSLANSAISASKDPSRSPAASETPYETSTKNESAPAQPETSSTYINLNSWTDYHDINIFLSNFAEWPAFYEQYGSFNRDSPNMKQLANWGMWHNVVNNGFLETGSYEPAGAPMPQAAAELGQSNIPYTRRMKTEHVNNSLQQYFGRPFDLTGYNSGDGSYYETDGYLYEGVYRGSQSDTCRLAVVNSVADMGNALVSVNFSIVISGASQDQIKPNDYWYGLSYDELASTLRSAGAPTVRTTNAHAIVQVAGSGSDKTFQLVSFSVG